ncbi:calcium-independent phospholipase A2-gamma-like isoform X1 [Hippocampus comes]|uniref:Patatin like phospholipase domain containing 8 n=1 Tax=Hippocampus comes TaxID=109280 RepID=A0A3Q2Y4T7_HIPCM|nr:PREDICTED: calcium-independent phospholipase A2-gamma-like isoform X1 [Hippocampus comes]XP_019750364.1 PREDICTED: calcium-independent phospholipase A2-gamma-like isoform X1 [Hippocampus comes]XP_019750365.1 PREDICTED: calcium-independent phospholipase A2-gamma-like isoform X1 [Hippocampus comes]XP_019750366.1 PREDICTED: calcium-independent phospholipase A2-gamma-like isoform X1 [Hippocampus comes]
MSHTWCLSACLKPNRTFYLWSPCKSASSQFPFSGTLHCSLHVQHPPCRKVILLSQKHVLHSRLRAQKERLCRANQVVRQKLGLHTSGLHLNTSASRWSTGLSQHMSRVKNTLDTVSKAVTQTNLLSKIARLKTNKGGKNVASTTESKIVEITPVSPAAPKNQVSLPCSPSSQTSVAKLEGGATAPSPPQPRNTSQASATAAIVAAREVREKKLQRVNATVKPEEPQQSSGESGTLSSKQPTALFHPSTFSVNLDETYNYLAHHINSYFGSITQKKDVDNHADVASNPPSQVLKMSDSLSNKPDHIPPTAPTSSKKGLSHYLSYSAPTVQAFVGSYIAPLVPKFRTGETKSATDEVKKLQDEPVKQVEKAVSTEHKAAEEKAKKLLVQREKIIARVSVDNRTRALVQALHRATDVRVYISRVEDLSYHLLEFPETCGVAVKEKVIPCLLRLQQASDPGLREAVREALALVGYHKPVKGRGIRILSIDGGGLRGLLALQTLHKLEALTGKPIYKLFDYICGVSTGAILGFMLGIFQLPPSECDDLYRKLGSDVFKQNVIVGTVKMGWSHAFYDSEAWESMLKEKMGSHLLVETSRNPECPKVAAVSAIVNRGTPLKAYVFRNYNLLPGVRSHYLGGCQHQLWQAIRATSAAPGYFQEFPLGSDLHQDGGLLINNPTALAIHESKCLWPNTPLECVVSVGTGRFETAGKSNSGTYTSLKTKINNVISSATDTEEVHAMLDSFLPADAYFRFNPYVSEDIAIDDNRQEKMALLQAEGFRYLERNEEKLRKAAAILTREKGSMRRLADWVRTRADMYNFISLNSIRF